MRDLDIRKAFHGNELAIFRRQPETLIIDELGLCQGDVRIDIVVINGSMNGYEIKSEKDTLERLANQIRHYGKVLETVTIVTTESHLDKVKRMVPEWWGITVACEESADISFQLVTTPTPNGEVDAFSLAQLLWKDEALAVLEKYNSAKGLKRKPREHSWRALADRITTAQLSEEVRLAIKARTRWRSDSRHM